MISILQVALGGLAPPIIAAHVALAGLAPVAQPTSPRPSFGGSLILPRRLRDELRERRIDEDDLLLLVAACLDGNALLH